MTSQVQFQSLQLRELGPHDESAFLAWYDSWKNDSPEWATFTWKPGMTHSEHLKSLNDQKDSSKIPANRVPSTMLYAFLGRDIVGRFSIRHELNDYLQKRGGHVGYSVGPSHRRKGYAKEMFKQGIKYCQSLGLKKILIGCNDDNEASWRVIENFGGSLENRIFDSDEEEFVRRYWVDVKEALNPTLEMKEKVIGYIVRKKNQKVELLVFDHDKIHIDAGIQVPAGTVDPKEDHQQALLREIQEESGLNDLIVQSKIDQYSVFREIQNCHNRRHVYCLFSKAVLPDSWTHRVTGDGLDKNLNFHYYWINLETAQKCLAAKLGESIFRLKNYLQNHGSNYESN